MNVVQSIVKDQNHLRANVDQLAQSVRASLEEFHHQEILRQNDACRAVAGDGVDKADEIAQDVWDELAKAYERVQLIATRLGIALADIVV